MIQSSEIHAASIIGDVNAKASLVGDVSSRTAVQGILSTSKQSLYADVSLGVIDIIHSDMPDYKGDYSVTPSLVSQELNTENKTLRENIIINSIPYYDVANPYGRTIYIGSDVNA
jgi:hypothetical protein